MATQTFNVTVPPGSGPGSTVPVITPDGQTFNVTVPQGMSPGQTFVAALPTNQQAAPQQVEVEMQPARVHVVHRTVYQHPAFYTVGDGPVKGQGTACCFLLLATLSSICCFASPSFSSASS